WELHFSQPLPRWNANWGVDTSGQVPWRQTVYRTDAIESVKIRPFITPFVEWKPWPDLQLHFEIQDIFGPTLRDTRNQYAGPRDRSGLLFTDDRLQHFGREYYFRVRKYFGEAPRSAWAPGGLSCAGSRSGRGLVSLAPCAQCLRNGESTRKSTPAARPPLPI